MSKLQNGDIVKIGDKEVTVVGSWGQGKHMAYRLSDDTVVLDLHLAVASGEVEKVTRRTSERTYGIRSVAPTIEEDVTEED